MNICMMMGRLVRDPETKTAGETTVTRMTIAVDRKFKKEGQQEADFIPCVAFGKTADFISKYFTKGMKIVIEGKWQTGSYTNKDGQKVYTNDCVVEQVYFAESKRETTSAPTAPAEVDDFMNLAEGLEDEMPFK